MKMFLRYDAESVCTAHLAHDDKWAVVAGTLGAYDSGGLFHPLEDGRWVQWPHDTLQDLPRIGEVMDPAAL